MRLSPIIAVVAALSGCATAWHNPDPSASLDADKAECRALASQGITMPAPPPTGPSYRVEGTAHTTRLGDPIGSDTRFSATAVPQRSSEQASQEGFYEGQAIRASIDRRRLADACMIRRGWAKGAPDVK